MELHLNKKPKNPIVIDGFPGFGLVGTIATEFLIEHLKTQEIGVAWFEDLPATIAIHESKLIKPISIHYASKPNIVIVHSISAAQQLDWKAAGLVDELANKLSAKKIISLEGVGTTAQGIAPTAQNCYYYTSIAAEAKKLDKLGAKPLKESIIIGVTAALLLKSKKPVVALFAQAQTDLPDSKAAASLLELFNKYIGIKVDTKPLLKMAEKFEDKIKTIIKEAQQTTSEQERKKLSYVG